MLAITRPPSPLGQHAFVPVSWTTPRPAAAEFRSRSTRWRVRREGALPGGPRPRLSTRLPHSQDSRLLRPICDRPLRASTDAGSKQRRARCAIDTHRRRQGGAPPRTEGGPSWVLKHLQLFEERPRFELQLTIMRRTAPSTSRVGGAFSVPSGRTSCPPDWRRWSSRSRRSYSSSSPVVDSNSCSTSASRRRHGNELCR